MIVKFYNSYTSHEIYLEFSKEAHKSERNKVRLEWIAKDLGAPKDWENDIDWKVDVKEAYEVSEETIIRPKKIK